MCNVHQINRFVFNNSLKKTFITWKLYNDNYTIYMLGKRREYKSIIKKSIFFLRMTTPIYEISLSSF